MQFLQRNLELPEIAKLPFRMHPTITRGSTSVEQQVNVPQLAQGVGVGVVRSL